MEKYSCSLPSFFRKVERKNMAANYAKIRDGGKGAGLHYRAFEGFSRVVALNLRQLRREDFQIATRIREVGLTAASPHRHCGQMPKNSSLCVMPVKPLRTAIRSSNSAGKQSSISTICEQRTQTR